MSIVYTAILLVLLVPVSDCFGNGFAPADSQVKSGDQLVRKNYFRKDKKAAPVYNAIQCGAFIMIKFYQKAISPQDGPSCRYHPTCSVYGSGAVERFGPLVGSFLAGDRIIRCNPARRPGVDPVPEKIFR